MSSDMPNCNGDVETEPSSSLSQEAVCVPADHISRHATENLKKRPKKSILKSSHSVESNDQLSARKYSSECVPNHYSPLEERGTHFDEMNIMATLHPAEKDYGHMKIDEPKTPYSYHSDSECEDMPPSERVRRVSLSEHRSGIDPSDLNRRLATDTTEPKALIPGCDDGDDDSEEQQAKRRAFEMKRKRHYDEGQRMKLAKQLLKEELEAEINQDDDDSNMESSSATIPMQ